MSEVRALHDALWRIEPGPEHAKARDIIRRRYFAAYERLVPERAER